jgi:putative endonuclease
VRASIGGQPARPAVDRHYYVYILANKSGGVLYTGVTGNICQRIDSHRRLDPKTFTGRYRVTRLVFYEQYTDVIDAIQREKQIKAGSRRKKVKLISALNPTWRDLTEDLTPFD